MLLGLTRESSERSDSRNWAKRALVERGIRIVSLEGCNQNVRNVTTHLFERAAAERVEKGGSRRAVLAALCELEGSDDLAGKIAVCRHFGLPLQYIVYTYNPQERVYRFEIDSLEHIDFFERYESVRAFGEWLASIKGWRSRKSFAESQSLPRFDRDLRRNGTPWPTNVDGFVVKRDGTPAALIEFQNADRDGVRDHSNNRYFWGYRNRDDDRRRWLSQEILRVQSGLPLFVLTWAARNQEHTITLKRVDRVVLPSRDPNSAAGTSDSLLRNHALREDYSTSKAICESMSTYHLDYGTSQMNSITHRPPLSVRERTFPQIYYSEDRPEISIEETYDILSELVADT